MPPLAFVATPWGPVRYAQAGSGPDVVLVHGAMTSVEDMLLGPFEPLSRAFRVTAFDRPGHGATHRRRLDGGARRQAGHLLAAMTALGIEQAVVVGQSFGAAVALDLALEAPERVRGVLAISPLAFPEWRLEHLLYGARSIPGLGDLIAYGPGRAMDAAILPALWHAMFAPQGIPAHYAEHYPFKLASGADQMLALGEEAVQSMPDLAEMASRYPDCEPPVTVIAGTADWVASPWRHAVRLAALAPNARLHLLPGLGHMLHHFAQGEVVKAVEDLAAREAA